MSISPIQNVSSLDRNDRLAPPERLPCREVQLGDLNWRVRVDLAEEILSEGGLDIEQRLRDGSATVVKSGDHRTVYRLQLPCGRFYLKHYRAADWKSQLRNCLRRCPAQREWNAIEAVADAGIPTIEPAALGMRTWGPFVADSFLLTRAVEPAETLHDYVRKLSEPGERILPARRQKLAVRLGTLIATLHANGLVHGDLHAGNVLIRNEPGGELQLWLIDLHAIGRRRWISLRRLARNLAMFAHFFTQYGAPADRLRFFQSYWDRVNQIALPSPSVAELARVQTGDCERRNSCEFRYVSLPETSDPASRRHIIRSVEAACAEWSERAFDKADRKWLRGHRKLIIVDTEAAHCRGVAELGGEFLRLVGRHPDVLQSGLLTIAGNLQTTFDRPQHPGIRIHVGPAGEPVQLRWLGRNQRWPATRVRWEMGHALLRRGIPTPRPLLFVEERFGPQRRAFLVTESPRQWDGDVPARTRVDAERTAIRQAARILRRLHGHGLIHTRLSESAFVVAKHELHRASLQKSQGFSKIPGICSLPAPATTRVLLSQVDAVRSLGDVSPEQVVEQLSQLNSAVPADRFTPADRLRFLLAYLRPDQRGAWKSVWREIAGNSPAQERPDVVRRRRFLRAAMALAGLSLGCQTPKQTVLTRPARHSIRSGQLVVFSNLKLPKHHPLIEDLILLRKQITVALDLPLQREEVAIYIFSTEKEFRDYLNAAYPGLPNRRAFFMGSRDELAVYTYWGERIQEDLRHEYTHGLLHASLRTVPLWLDEGLAEYFEVAGPRPGTVNTEYSGRLAASVANGWRPNLAALERLEEFSRMQHIHYQESWAWVHYMLHDTVGAKPVLLAYLHDLRTQSHPTPLSERLKRQLPDAEARFLAHASTLQTPQLLPPARVVRAAGAAQSQPFPTH
jgi:tRNA A-37 threonylcarbamoyl transferase component Bud32